MTWKNKIKSWYQTENSVSVDACDIDPAVIAPLIIKILLARKYPLIVIFPVISLAEEINNQLEKWIKVFSIQKSTLYLPEAVDGSKFMPENESERSNAIYTYLNTSQDLVLTSVSGLVSPAPSPDEVLDRKIELRKGMIYPFSKLLEKLVEMDYDDEYEVNVPNEFAKRGGIIDIFSPSAEFPVRVEFFGDEIDSMRLFSPETQRSVKEISEYVIIPRAGIINEDTKTDFYDYIRKSPHEILVVYPEQCKLHIERFSSERNILRWNEIMSGETQVIKFFEPGEDCGGMERISSGCYPSTAHISSGIPDEVEELSTEIIRQMLAGQIKQWVDSGYSVALLGNNEASLCHINEWCERFEIDKSSIEIDAAELPFGIIIPDKKIVFLTEKELFLSRLHRKNLTLVKPQPQLIINKSDIPDLSAFTDFEEGDYVVHLEHGIGVFRGIQDVKSRDGEHEALVLEYADNAKLYVPMWQANLISRYIGSKRGIAQLSRIGEKKWLRSKVAAARSVREMAMEMLRMHAVRASVTGFAFAPDDINQRLFEQAFPYEDTRDQVKAATEIKSDLCQPKPMDRLLCGDVGYGKTEVAIRAVFKCVMSGKQVAILVPTTILAQQHLYNFQERFAEYPVIIEMLSRFRTKKEQRETIERLAEGKVDIIIGTHRLVQDDVKFKDLGLVIIDEEQRFGVDHKEKLKRLRTTVDVLTMTATPIPRTLYMAMTGIRDLSTIMTAPGIRLPVQTIVTQYEEKTIVSAIEKEIQRGGQVYYLHNRVKTIENVCLNLKKLLPSVRFAVAHGRMGDDELEKIMLNFIEGNVDVLVCTTIIESGLDIPNANTMIIDRCDRFGLAELYQLRGRIGRWSRQAFAYLLLPKHDILSGDARKRISAIRRYTHLGAGFKLALRDLEIRGAGNLLGSEQSGHINSIGFDLYCQFLRSTVASLKGESDGFLPEVNIALDFVNFGHSPPKNKISACFPPDYIPAEKLRLEAYRKLSALSSLKELDSFAEELKDRFGELPPPALNMLMVSKIKIAAGRAGYRSISISENKLLIENKNGYYRKDGKIPEFSEKMSLEKKLLFVLKIVSTIAS